MAHPTAAASTVEVIAGVVGTGPLCMMIASGGRDAPRDLDGTGTGDPRRARGFRQVGAGAGHPLAAAGAGAIVVAMPRLRSATSTQGRNMAGARALWRATGMTDNDFGKPIVAIANSFTQFVPGHVHLRNLGALVADAVAGAGGVAKEFNTIAVDDGIAMGHGGMLYSLPSRELIADSVEY